MDVSFEKVDILSTPKVGFYTLRLGEDPETEYEKFDGRAFPQHQEEFEIIIQILRRMGLSGAKPYFFRDESGAHALPHLKDIPIHVLEANQNDQGIRLYCIRLTDHIVILLNGDIKTTQKPQNCPNVRNHFKNAVRLAKAITQAKLDEEIKWNNSSPSLTPLKTSITIDF